MYQKVKVYIEKHHMLRERDTVIAGVSGGADSVCLLFILLELQKELDLEIVAVHVHHGLRGESADADETYVKELCRTQGVELLIYHEDVRAYAVRNRLTLEEAGRNVRRKIFAEVMEKRGADRIALAHHQNDNVETLIWNLCRGSGLKGIGGIAPVEGAYIRPFLCVQRKEIELYLKKREISYCTDESNLEDHYTRNKIRNHVIPYLEEEINEQTVAHMAETVEQMRRLGEYVEQEVSRALGECVCYKEESYRKENNREENDIEKKKIWILDKKKYQDIPEIIRSYMLHELMCRAAGRRKDIESVHVKILEELLDHQVGREVHLPYGMTARRCYEGIELMTDKEEAEMFPVSDRESLLSGDQIDQLFSFHIYDRKPGEVIFPKCPYTKWFDYDIIKNTVEIRHRKTGDYITIDKYGNTQKLKQYFINEKVPARLRDEIWLAADGHHIMWIIGYRQNQMYQITENTRWVLEIKFNGGEEDGRKCQGVSAGRRS